MVFPFAIHTHAHIPCLCECMALLSPNPPPVEQDGFPFCSETHTRTHTHTPHVSVYVWHSLSVHALLLSLRSILWCAGQAGYDTGCGTPVMGVLQASRLQALVFGRGGYHWGGGGAENAQRTTIWLRPCVCVCARPSVMSYHAYHVTSCTCTYVCMYVCMHACMYVYILLYKHISSRWEPEALVFRLIRLGPSLLAQV